MSREIKFRNWNQDNQEFQYLILSEGGHWSHTIEAHSLNAMQGWQQYTGLTGKNGREIYEGDIVLEDGNVWTVVFNEGAFCLSKGVGKGTRYITFWNRDVIQSPEVIGNIYENPELLS